MSRLSPRQSWVLQYLRSHGRPCSAIWYFDDGADFIAAYQTQFLCTNTPADVAQKSIYRVLSSLAQKKLVDAHDGSNHGGMFMDTPPSHCNDYVLTARGRRYAERHRDHSPKSTEGTP